MPSPVKILRTLLLIICFGVCVISLLNWDSSSIANDGVQYLSTASNWLNGKGFSTDALIYTSHFQGQIPAAQTIWPPGYSLAIAVTSLTGLELQRSALLLNLFGHLLASFLIYLILKRLSVARDFSIVAACLFFLTAISWHYTLGLLTEPVFTAITLAIIALLPQPGRTQWHRYLACGLLAAAAVYVRYSAMFFAFSLSLVYLGFSITQTRDKLPGFVSDFRNLTLLSAPPVLALIHLMIRNKLLTGNMRRETGFDTPETVTDTIKLFIGHTADILGFSSGGLYSHSIGLLLFVALILTALLISFYAARSLINQSAPHGTPEQAMNFAQRSLSVIMVHTLIFILYLAYCSLTDSPISITTRYIFQVYPGLFILFCFLLWISISAAEKSNHTRISSLLRIGSMAFIAIFLVAQYNEAAALPRFSLKAKIVKSGLSLAVNDSQKLGTFISSCFADTHNPDNASATIWSTHGQQMQINTGVPTLTRTEIYANQKLDFDELSEQIVKYNIRLFVFFDDVTDVSTEHIAAMNSIKTWLPENGHTPITLDSNLTPYDIAVQVFGVDGQCREHL